MGEIMKQNDSICTIFNKSGYSISFEKKGSMLAQLEISYINNPDGTVR